MPSAARWTPQARTDAAALERFRRAQDVKVALAAIATVALLVLLALW